MILLRKSYAIERDAVTQLSYNGLEVRNCYFYVASRHITDENSSRGFKIILADPVNVCFAHRRFRFPSLSSSPTGTPSALESNGFFPDIFTRQFSINANALYSKYTEWIAIARTMPFSLRDVERHVVFTISPSALAMRRNAIVTTNSSRSLDAYWNKAAPLYTTRYSSGFHLPRA